MTDFLGLGGGIEKIEEYLGRRVTAAFIVLSVLAISAVCMKAIWDNLIQPIVAFLQTPVWGQSLLSYLWVAVTVMLGVAGGLQFAASFTRWRYVREIKSTTDRARAILDETRKETGRMFEESNALYDRSKGLFKSATELFDSAKEDAATVGEFREEVIELMSLAVEHAKAAIIADPSLSDDARQERLAVVEQQEQALKDFADASGTHAEAASTGSSKRW